MQCVPTISAIQSYMFTSYAQRAGVGDVVAEVTNVESVTSCVVECASSDACTSANYANNTCTLLNVQDQLDDWQDSKDVTYMCKNHEMEFAG
jgi:hypothetical protein